jgi:hypothetical protein
MRDAQVGAGLISNGLSRHRQLPDQRGHPVAGVPGDPESYPDDPSMRLCAEAIYQGLFAGRLGRKQGRLRTGRLVRRRQRRGRR